MRKRIMTLLLALLFLFQWEAETFYAAAYAPKAYTAGTEAEALTGDNDNTEVTDPGSQPGARVSRSRLGAGRASTGNQ